MSERGVFAVDRGIWTDPDFADEPFSEREAFLWLVSEAAWRPTRVRVGSATVDLARGQCAFSTRFMAQKWKWSEARVRRFFKRLMDARIIDATADARATHVTICKYDRFQRVSLPSDALADATATHSRRTSVAPATQERRKEEDRENITSSLRSEGSPSEPRPVEAFDPRRDLFGRGLAAVRQMTGAAEPRCRTLLGKWLKGAEDSAVIVMAAIDETQAAEVASPIPYIETIIAREARRNASAGPAAPRGGPHGNGFSTLAERKAQGDVSVYDDPFAHLDRPRARRPGRGDDQGRTQSAEDAPGFDEAERGRLLDFDRLRAGSG